MFDLDGATPGLAGAISMGASNKVAMRSIKKECTAQFVDFFQFLQFKPSIFEHKKNQIK